MIQTREQGIETMLAEIDAEARITRRMTGRPGIDARIMDVMAKVPRDAFVPEALRASAFDNGPCRSDMARPSRNRSSSH